LKALSASYQDDTFRLQSQASELKRELEAAREIQESLGKQNAFLQSQMRQQASSPTPSPPVSPGAGSTTLSEALASSEHGRRVAEDALEGLKTELTQKEEELTQRGDQLTRAYHLLELAEEAESDVEAAEGVTIGEEFKIRTDGDRRHSERILESEVVQLRYEVERLNRDTDRLAEELERTREDRHPQPF